MAEYDNKQYIKWLEEQSLLHQAKKLAQEISGNKIQWQKPFALPQTDAALKTASVWFSAYPASMITRPKQNILQFLGDSELWDAFSEIGINALHTGPMKQAGGIVEKKYTPTVDGWFDRISFAIDSAFGNESDYLNMTQTAAKYNAIIAGDIIPGHTGKGADFLLALRNYDEYPGIYDLIEIEKADWDLLPKVNEWESVNLDKTTVNELYEKGYIPGSLQRVLFLDPYSKQQVTGWDATGNILGVDGKTRRWVYLHYFKPGQPTMNWSDPSHTAERIIAGDIIKSIHVLKNKIVRLDANPFLGIECKPKSNVAWSEGHPLSTSSSNNIAALTRKLGGWSFQELNLTLDSISSFSEYGPDLSYDFITRPALQHAMLTKDATFLRFMFELMQQYNINPKSLIHGMQNHDEITYELVHFLEHGKDTFKYAKKNLTGKQLRENIVKQMRSHAISSRTPYNRLSGNGLCTTYTGLIATRLGIPNVHKITFKQRSLVKQGHILMVLFNAMQPGVFDLSGWDLVGALPMPFTEIQHLLKDKDYRWINRGAYDLLGCNNHASTDNIPKAKALYGPITSQLKDPNSFVSQLKHILKIRKKYHIDLAEQIAVPHVRHKNIIIMIHKLPNHLGYQITALNFGDRTVTEKVALNEIKPTENRVINLLTNQKDSKISAKILPIKLQPLQGKILLIK